MGGATDLGSDRHHRCSAHTVCVCVSTALLTRTFQDHVMCFTQTRKQAHRLHILLGLLGLKVGELHGELSQHQRLENLRYTHTHTQAAVTASPAAAADVLLLLLPGVSRTSRSTSWWPLTWRLEVWTSTA